MSQKPSVISGVVHDVRGRPVEQARIYFTSGPVPLPEIATLTGSDGTFALSAPAPGTYQIEAATDTSGTVRAEVTVEEGKEARVKIKLKR